MTTELLLLLGMFAFILGGAFLGDNGPRKVFERSAPRLGAHIERQVTIGRRFNFRNGAPIEWQQPGGAAPLGSP